MPRERQAAYDFIESGPSPDALHRAMASAALKRLDPHATHFLCPLDGSSLSLARAQNDHGLGRIGTHARGALGLKVITAYALRGDGVPVGIVDQQWWTRPKQPTRSRDRNKACQQRRRSAPQHKEIVHWMDAIDTVRQRVDALQEHTRKPGPRPWFQIDREGDARPILLKLNERTDDRFTVRAAWNRRLCDGTGQAPRTYLRPTLAAQRPHLTRWIEVPAGPHRQARTARLELRAARVTLRLQDKWTKKVVPLELTAVWVNEVGTTPAAECGLDWLLLTNAPVQTEQELLAVLDGYVLRWRIEEFHRTWKSGLCASETMQVSGQNAPLWGTILAAVAARSEHLKHLSRHTPEAPATEALTRLEVRALLLLKGNEKKRTETIANTTPTLGQAVRWLADLGGYEAGPSRPAPGTVLIARGLERVQITAAAFEIAIAQGLMNRDTLEEGIT